MTLVCTLISLAGPLAPVAPAARVPARATAVRAWSAATGQARYGWPLPVRPSVSRPFQPPTHRYGPGHRGADLMGRPGEAVLAAGDGVVVHAGPLAGRGVVSIQHADGLRTTYEPVAAIVRGGQRVARGQTIGTLTPGHPGCPAPACLHWGLRRDDEYLDPLRLVRPARVRLLPWPPATGPP